MIKFTKQQIKDLTYNDEILESDGRISGFITKDILKIWVPLDDIYFTDDNEYYDNWLSRRHNITVGELRAMRLKTKERINNYFNKK